MTFLKKLAGVVLVVFAFILAPWIAAILALIIGLMLLDEDA